MSQRMNLSPDNLPLYSTANLSRTVSQIDKTTWPEAESLTYSCAPAITWLHDADQILLVDGAREQFWFLQGVQAAIWDWLVMAYPYDKLVLFLSLTLKVSAIAAEAVLTATLHDWHSAGILQIIETGYDGKSGN